MNPEELSRYAGAVFGFCLKRLGNIEEARDLSQEILCEALASLDKRTIDHPEAWLWSIARNRYCRYLRKKKSIVLSLDDGSLLDLIPEAESEDLSEEYQAAFAALHTLASSHREIMVDFYVNGLSCDEIAKKHSLPPKTIRTRLFYGREKLRERWRIKMDDNHIYQKHQWLLTRNGDVNPAIVDRQIVRSILSSCYEKFQSVEELSLLTGIPSLYIEDEIPQLLYAELLECKGKKYRSKLIVHRANFAAESEALLFKHSIGLTNHVVQTLREITPSIRALGFFGCDLPESRLWWCIVPRLIQTAYVQAIKSIPELSYTYRPVHRDGTKGWLCAYEDTSSHSSQYDFLLQKGYRCYWSHELYSTLTLHSLLARLKSMQIIGPQFSITDELLIADCIRCDLAIRTPDGIKWNIPIFDAGQLTGLNQLLSAAAVPLVAELSPSISILFERMKMEVPVHLHDQICGIFPMEFLSVIQMISHHMQQKGYLQKPRSGLLSGRVSMFYDQTAHFSI